MLIWGMVLLSALIWLYLLLAHGGFWRCDQRLDADHPSSEPTSDRWPSVVALVPARNEADVIETSIGSLLAQDYPGDLRIVVTDDASEDDTGARLSALAADKSRLAVVVGAGPAPGWSGKLYALEQAQRAALVDGSVPDYWWLSDADIAHDPAALRRLVTKAVGGRHALVSVMVRLRDEGFWPGLMIPAFVFFFQMLYPFRRINDPRSPMAGAAGGCVLVASDALARIGGFGNLRDALIDDCTLGQRIKHRGSEGYAGGIWLGLSNTQQSIRPYAGLQEIWHMVARTAFTQLGYSPLQLIGTVLGMALVFMAGPLALLVGLAGGHIWLVLGGVSVWLLMALAYRPMLDWYRRPWYEAGALPLCGFFYTLMTLDSARRYWLGRGGNWKGRHQASQTTG